jgi:hypothetical protein
MTELQAKMYRAAVENMRKEVAAASTQVLTKARGRARKPSVSHGVCGFE